MSKMQQLQSLQKCALALLVTMTLLALAACATTAPATSVPATPDEIPAAVATAATAEATPEATGDEATLIVQLDETRTLVRKINFTAPMSGLALLQSSTLDIEIANLSFGSAVCSIEAVGCPADDCFCHDNLFWGYLNWQDGDWSGYPVGPSQSIISTTGVVEGWQWGTGATPPPSPVRAEAAHKALKWLRAQQMNADGSYEGSGAASVETLLAAGANREDANEWRVTADAPSLLDFVLAEGASTSHESVSAAGKLAVALSAADACWPADAMKPSDYYSPTLGTLHPDAGPLAWGILGVLALDEPTPTDSVEYLINLALPEGGWEWSLGWGRDTNSTALAVQALIAAGVPATDTVISSGQAYLLSAQTDEGGYSYDPNAAWGNVADANSTAYVMQALAALGIPAPDEAAAYLINLQGEEGALGWQTEQAAPNLGATQQAVSALLGQFYPLQRVALPVCE